jgi:hypothetical protein
MCRETFEAIIRETYCNHRTDTTDWYDEVARAMDSADRPGPAARKGNHMTVQFEKLKARLFANLRVKAEYDALAPEFEIEGSPARGPLPGRARSPDGHQPIHDRPAGKRSHASEHQDAAAICRGDRQQVSGAAIGGLRCTVCQTCPVIARSEATKQSNLSFHRAMDCFASLAMTTSGPPAISSLQSSRSKKGPDNVEAPLTISCRAISCRDE